MATLPNATFSAPGVPLYQPYGTSGQSLSTLGFANSYTWEGSTISTNFVSFQLSNVSSSLVQIGAANPGGGSLVADVLLNGSTGNLYIDAPGSINLNTLPNGLVNVAALNASSISTNFVDCSGISTSVLDIDGQALTATPTELLLNGIPIATTANLSSIADWAIYPAVSTVNMVSKDIVSAATVYCENLLGKELVGLSNGVTTALFTSDAVSSSVLGLVAGSDIFTIGVQSDISTVQMKYFNGFSNNAGISFTPDGIIFQDNLTNQLGGYPADMIIQSNTVYANRIVAGSGVFTDLSTTTLTVLSTVQHLSSVSSVVEYADIGIFSTLQAGSFSTPEILVSSVRGTPDVTITADAGVALNVPEITMIAKNGTGGKVKITADVGAGDSSFGAVEITANGGTTLGVGTGGSINITANTPIGTLCNASSKISLSAAGINSYAGAVPPIGSLLGYNFTYGTLGINQCVGLPSVVPNFPGTLYQYATGGVGYGGIRLESPAGVELIDNTDLYAYRIYPYYNPFFIGTYADLVVSGRSNLVGNNQYLNLSSVRGLEFGFSEVKGYINGLSSINGQPLSYYEPGVVSTVSSFINLTTSNLTVSSIINPNQITLEAAGAINLNSDTANLEVNGGAGWIKLNAPSEDIYLNPSGSVNIGGGGNLVVTSITNLTSINGLPISDYENTSTFTNILLTPSTLLESATGFSELRVLNPTTLSTAQVCGSAFNAKSYSTDPNFGFYTRNTSNRALYVDSNFTSHQLLYTVDSNANISTVNANVITTSSISATGGAFNTISTSSISATDGAFNTISTGSIVASTITGIQGLFSSITTSSLSIRVSTNSVVSLVTNQFAQLGFDTFDSVTTLRQDKPSKSFSITNFGGTGFATLNLRSNSADLSAPGTTVPLSISTNVVSCEVISSLQAVADINTTGRLNFTGISTVNFSTSATVGAQGQPVGRLVMAGQDLDVSQDIWCQQLKVAANNTANQAEIIIYQPDNGQKQLNIQSGDRSIRIGSSQLGGVLTNPGYILDTFVNPCFFSSLAGVSTALMAYFPSTNASTIGISTLSVIPPLSYYASIYSSTSQTVVGANTSTLTTYNATALNVGGFTRNANSITVPVGGTYEITASIQFDTTSGGTNLAEFWMVKNGLAIPQTNSRVSIVNNGDTLGTISIFDTAVANDTYGIMFYSSDVNMTAAAVAAGATPGIPSIILNIKRLG